MSDSQILELSATPVDYTVFDVRWVPMSPRLAVCGSSLAGEGTVRVYSLAGQVGGWPGCHNYHTVHHRV